MTEEVRELARDAGGEGACRAIDGENAAVVVGRFGARSRVSEGETVEVAVDTRALHFFDPETGLGIYDDRRRKEPAREATDRLRSPWLVAVLLP